MNAEKVCPISWIGKPDAPNARDSRRRGAASSRRSRIRAVRLICILLSALQVSQRAPAYPHQTFLRYGPVHNGIGQQSPLISALGGAEIDGRPQLFVIDHRMQVDL